MNNKNGRSVKINGKMDTLNSLIRLSKTSNIDQLELLALSFRMMIESGEKSDRTRKDISPN